MVSNGSTQRVCIDRYDAAIPTAASNAIIITGVIEAKHGIDVMINDVPNDFVQTPVTQCEGDGRIVMNIVGELVDILFKISL